MKFKKGADIYSSVGERIGQLQRVVLDQETNRISHLVIEKGILVKEDKVIPIGLVQDQEEGRIGLSITAEELKEFPAFTETQFVLSTTRTDDTIPAGYRAVSSYHWMRSGNLLGYATPKLAHRRLGNIPEGAVALKEGAEVMSANGEKIGYLQNVISNAENNEITHFVVSGGLLSQQKRLVPIFWVDEISSRQIDLKMKTKYFENLPLYKVA